MTNVVEMDKNNRKPTDEEWLKNGLDLLSDACCSFYEMESDTGISIAYMANAVLSYGVAILEERDPRLEEQHS